VNIEIESIRRNKREVGEGVDGSGAIAGGG
jgi:hypothetical protein